MDEAKALIFVKTDYAGIGVGLLSDYGKARRFKVKSGYIPDGLGIDQAGKPLNWGGGVKKTINYDLVL
jgi:hypothetical protein